MIRLVRGPLAVALLVAAMLYGPSRPASAETLVTFSFRAGPATWTVPAGVTSATFEVLGARGGKGVSNFPSGKGAKVVATIAVTPGEVLQVNVGGQGGNIRSSFGGTGLGGWNGGGDGGACDADQLNPCSGAGGGGASDVRRNSGGGYSLAERLIVAAGGGGNSRNKGHDETPPKGLGGDGGGLVGVDGLDGRNGGAGACHLDVNGGVVGDDLGTGIGGVGGVGAAGGSGGVGGASGDAAGAKGANTAGGNGTLGTGGRGGDAFACATPDAGGGGGGGYYGGGGGGGASTGNGGGGGGGGSSFGPDGAVYTQGVQDDNGLVKITFTPGDPVPAEVHDFAITKMTVPKSVTLKSGAPAVKRVSVTVQNRSPQDEVIADAAGLVTLSVLPLAAGCSSPAVAYAGAKPSKFPLTLAPKKSITLAFDVTFDCAVDPAKTSKKSPGHEDFRFVATVRHQVIDGKPDTHPADDVCPRPALPGGIDPNPDGKLKDTGCGAKFPDGTLGADVLTDVVVK